MVKELTEDKQEIEDKSFLKSSQGYQHNLHHCMRSSCDQIYRKLIFLKRWNMKWPLCYPTLKKCESAIVEMVHGNADIRVQFSHLQFVMLHLAMWTRRVGVHGHLLLPLRHNFPLYFEILHAHTASNIKSTHWMLHCLWHAWGSNTLPGWHTWSESLQIIMRRLFPAITSSNATEDVLSGVLCTHCWDGPLQSSWCSMLQDSAMHVFASASSSGAVQVVSAPKIPDPAVAKLSIVSKVGECREDPKIMSKSY